MTAEGANQIVSATAVDKAGNTVSLQVTLNIDKTAPLLVSTASPDANASGWNNTPVAVTFAATDALSGVVPTSLSLPVILTADGTNLSATGQATDLAGNTGSITRGGIRIDQVKPVVTASLDPAPNPNGWNRTQVTVHFTCADGASGVAACPSAQTVSGDGAHQTVSGTAIDNAGNMATAAASVSIDSLPPVVHLTSPAAGTTLFTPSVLVQGTVTEDGSGIVSVTCNNAPATTAAGNVECSATLTPGANSISLESTDMAGNTSADAVSLIYARVPKVTITSLANLSYLNLTPTTVTGTVDDPDATVTINSLPAPVTGGAFTLALPLAEGPNIITVVATTAAAVGTSSIEVTLDTTPPHVTITSPIDGFVTEDPSIAVASNVNDIVVGTVNEEQAQVTVNGDTAAVANRLFLAGAVPLNLGQNVIQAVGIDRVGNAATTSIKVFRIAPQAQSKIQLISGNNQSGTIGTMLAAPLVISLIDPAGNPVAGKPVIFKVTQNDGLVSDTGDPGATALATTDAQGHADAQWTLGMRAGAGGNIVEAYAVGFAGTAVFTATGVLGDPAKIVVDTGNDQIGAIGQPLPKPFIAVVVDGGNNRRAQVPVTFTVKEGGGSFDGSSTTTVNSDSDGRVATTLTLGVQEGNANNVVEAGVATASGLPAVFTASGRAPGDPVQTTISGVVLDNSNNPIPGVAMRAVLTTVLNANANAVQSIPEIKTNAEGQFTIPHAPVGLVKLLADGSTALLPGPYPSLEYDVVTVAGQDNTVGQPIFLLPLNTANQLCVTATSGGGTLTIPEAPGFSLTFAPNQVTFPGGSKDGCVSVTVVNREKVPMAPGFGQQPRFIVTIQPSGAVFNPPAAITLPNVDGLKPRAVTEMYSFDHDIGSFVAIGTGVVSDDGQVIRSSPGVGVLKAGWHCGGDPNASGSVADCPVCKWCQGSSCVPDPAQETHICPASSGDDGLCKMGSCVVPTVSIDAEAIDQDDPDNTSYAGTSGPVYGGSAARTADNLRLKAKTSPASIAVTSYEWSFEGPGSFAPGSDQTWDLGDLAAAPGKVTFKVKVTFEGGLTKEQTKEIEIGVRTDDIASIGWIDPAAVPLSTAGMDSWMTDFYPPGGAASMSVVQKGLTTLHLGLLAAGSTIHPFYVRSMTAAERTYVLNWMFKFGANFCASGRCPPNSFASNSELDNFRTSKRTSYKLFNRFQIKYLAEGGMFKGSPTVVRQATEIGVTNNPVWDIEESGAAGPNNGKYATANGDTAFLINDGTPTSIAVSAFNTLADPLKWSNIGSRIELGAALGSNYQIFTQVYPTYFVFGNLTKKQTIPQAPAPIGNFSTTPYPPGPAPFIR